ncbi:DUF397 domain-containing protein [Actinomadura sediminis]|uniref:DUF397 domain-containing protein n=1 Tax=Actinomadura sediminis TaxID=1038904 RepID=A0ABW3ESC4_9ACTN
MDLRNATWRKVRRNTENGRNCVEIASVVGAVAVRDSKDPGRSQAHGEPGRLQAPG